MAYEEGLGLKVQISSNAISDNLELAPGESKRDWHTISQSILNGTPVGRTTALAALQMPDSDLPDLLAAAFRIRRHYFGLSVQLYYLVNAKSGLCPEDCAYCSQSRSAAAAIERYPLLSQEELLAGARAAVNAKACTYCIVTSGRGPTDRELGHVAAAVREIKATLPLRICCCLGILSEGQAQKLKDAGVDRFNHNVNTSAGYHEQICGTHAYDDRVRTIEQIKQAGISPCSGGIVGMGEADKDVVDMAFALRDLAAESIPINFHHPVPGTRLENNWRLNPRYCLKVLCMFRLVNPTREIRIAGGRELHLRSLQPLGLYPANSIFIGDYLTTEGQPHEADFRMIEDLGFEIVGRQGGE